MKTKPNKIVWAGIPVTRCNLNCKYCYNRNRKQEKGKFLYSVGYMLKCLEPKRFGGPIFFGGAAVGETLLWDQITDFTAGMLSYGHVVSYTSNATYTPTIKKFCDFPEKLRSGLEIDASLHYLELKRTKKIDIFFENLQMLKSAGISIAIFLLIVDDYIPYLREINELCQKKIGLLPIAGMERNYSKSGGKNIKEYSLEVKKLVEETCDTRQWHLQEQLYGKKRTEFCYAGESSINLNLGNGVYTKCWGVEKLGNLFKNPSEPIKFEPIGLCPFYDCVCVSYQCWGLIPKLNAETHSKTFFTKSSVSNKIWDFMDYRMNNKIRSLSGSKWMRYKSKQRMNEIKNALKDRLKKIIK